MNTTQDNPFLIPNVKTVNIYTKVNNTKQKFEIKEIDKLTKGVDLIPVIHAIELVTATNQTKTPSGDALITDTNAKRMYLTLARGNEREQVLEDAPLSLLNPANYDGKRFITNLENVVLGSSYFTSGDSANLPASGSEETIMLVVYYTYISRSKK